MSSVLGELAGEDEAHGGLHLGLEFKVQGPGSRVQGSGFRVQSSGFRVQGSGFRVQGPGLNAVCSRLEHMHSPERERACVCERETVCM